MPEMNLRDAVGRGLREALDADDRVFMIGEDIGEFKGPYAVTNGFLEQYGPERVIDSPISEAAMVGAGIGSALGGLRPIIEIMTINFMLLAMDQVVNHAAKLRYMSNGQIKVPMVIRTVTGGGGQLGATHSQSPGGLVRDGPRPDGGRPFGPVRCPRASPVVHRGRRPRDLCRARAALQGQGRGAGPALQGAPGHGEGEASRNRHYAGRLLAHGARRPGGRRGPGRARRRC